MVGTSTTVSPRRCAAREKACISAGVLSTWHAAPLLPAIAPACLTGLCEPGGKREEAVLQPAACSRCLHRAFVPTSLSQAHVLESMPAASTVESLTQKAVRAVSGAIERFPDLTGVEEELVVQIWDLVIAR